MHLYRLCQVANCGNISTRIFYNNAYTCLERLHQNQNHQFCDQHSWLVNCPVHSDGKLKCQVYRCTKAHKIFSRTQYSCLKEGEYHFFVMIIPMEIVQFTDKVTIQANRKCWHLEHKHRIIWTDIIIVTCVQHFGIHTNAIETVTVL